MVTSQENSVTMYVLFYCLLRKTFGMCFSSKPSIFMHLKVRLPTNTSDDVDEDPSGTKALWDRGVLSGASTKLEVLCNLHVGETILSLQVSE